MTRRTQIESVSMSHMSSATPMTKTALTPLDNMLVRNLGGRFNKAIESLGCPIDVSDEFRTAKVMNLGDDDEDLIVCLPNFLSPEECEKIIKAAEEQIRTKSQDAESTLYLNYRVNREVESTTTTTTGGVSNEASALITEQGLTKEELDAGQGSGFRTQINPETITELVEIIPRVMRFMGLPHRKADFFEGIWVKPDCRTIVIRDQTVVRYEPGEGVAPHVDGKDLTLLMYLNDVEQESEGRTVFPHISLKVPPTRGSALLYNSKKSLLHYSESTKTSTKWICQVLIDHRYIGNGPFVDRTTGEIFYDN